VTRSEHWQYFMIAAAMLAITELVLAGILL
jgi:hypothetical protein